MNAAPACQAVSPAATAHPAVSSRSVYSVRLTTVGDAPKRPAARCSNCPLQNVCMPDDLTPAEFDRLDAIVCTTRHVRRGEALFRPNDTFHSLYVVRTGSFKTIVMHRDGDEQVTGFQIPGEPLGLDGVSCGRHNCEAIALEDSTVCIIPFPLIEQMCSESQHMQRHIHRLMSREIVRESGQMMLLGTMTAEQRLAAFLLSLSARFRARGYSAVEFNLKMKREEIGCFLGIKLETVSRMFSRFQRERLVEPSGKQIRIVDPEGLAKI